MYFSSQALKIHILQIIDLKNIETDSESLAS